MFPYRHILRCAFLASLAILLSLAFPPPAAHGQAPAPDSYEENDSLVAASSIPATVTLPNLTISPAQDVDFYRIIANPGPLSAQVFGTPGLDLSLSLTDPSGTVIATSNDPAGPNAGVTVWVPATAYYVLEVSSTTLLEGFYELRTSNMPPTGTPTSTINPTSTLPPYTATPQLGGAPDFAEPNYDFATAYRIAVGDQLKGLNFNSGTAGAKDNDFFVMPVRSGVRYACKTENLGPALDTNMIIYHSANTDDLVGGNDDVDTQAGQVNSRVSFTARADADVYILVGYKFPLPVDIRYPGEASYDFGCTTSLPTATPLPGPNGSTGSLPARTPQATPLAIEVFTQPTPLATSTSSPIQLLAATILVGYDANNNGQVDPSEGVVGLSVRVASADTNTQLAYGFTGTGGSVSFRIPTNGSVVIVVPYLAMTREFRPGSDASWQIVIPPANAPGLIP